MNNSVLAVLDDPQLAAAVAADRSLASAVAEETVRFTPPVRWVYRRVLAATTIDGRELLPGDTLLVCLGAVNRDPRVYREPDLFDVARQGQPRALSFGIGLHYCIGAGLARLEAEAAAYFAARQARRIRLLAPGAPPIRQTPTLHCPTEIHVEIID